MSISDLETYEDWINKYPKKHPLNGYDICNVRWLLNSPTYYSQEDECICSYPEYFADTKTFKYDCRYLIDNTLEHVVISIEDIFESLMFSGISNIKNHLRLMGVDVSTTEELYIKWLNNGKEVQNA